MKVIKKPASGNQVELEVTADQFEVNNALDTAGMYFARNMGLRPEEGKSVAELVEKAMNIKDLDTVVENDAIQILVPYALDKVNLVPAFAPEPMPSMSMKRGKEYSFRMFVYPKPDYELTNYDIPEVTLPKFKPDYGDIVDRQLEMLAEQNARYEDCEGEGPVESDSIFNLKLKIIENGVVNEGISTDARTYIMGLGYLPEDFEKNMLGMKVGETKTFTCGLPDWDKEKNEPCTTPAECEATVLNMQKKVIPAITDEWVKENIPMAFSKEMLEDSIRIQVSQAQRQQYDQFVKQRVVESLTTRFQGKIDDAVYEAASKNMIRDLRDAVAEQNLNWDQFVQENGGEQQMQMMLMMETRNMLVSGYVLDSFFRHEKLVIEEQDLMEACSQFNPQAPDVVRKELESTGRSFALREMAERCRAQRWLVANAKITYFDAEEAQAQAAAQAAAPAAEAAAEEPAQTPAE